jgi:N-formylglutamate amidohydrolase
VEVNRGLYMNERNFEKLDGFVALANDITALVARLMQMPPDILLPLPLAAE